MRAIERAAVSLALDHGVESLTVEQICGAVGITPRTFFNHFDTKDDALLGWGLPTVNEQRTQNFLVDATIPILAGVIGLIDLPAEMHEDPQLANDRFRLIGSTPALMHRQSARLRPLFFTVSDIIFLKLRALADADATEESLRAAAATVNTIAASLLVPLPLNDGGAPAADQARSVAESLDNVRWVWDRLI